LVHIDIKYLPQMQNEASRSYLFVAIDRSATGECEPTGDHLFDPVCR